MIHTVLATAIFFSYKEISAYFNDAQHPCACCTTTIKLSSIKTSQDSKSTEVKKVVKKIEKKVEKPLKHRKKQELKIEEKPTLKSLKKEPLQRKPEIKKVATVQDLPQPDKVVEKDSNETQTTQSKVKQDVDTHCESKVIVQEEDKNKEDDYLSLHVNEIVALLKENLYYPRRARKRGIEGIVTVKFTLSTDAKVSKIEVLKSDYDILSRAAIETIENLEGELPKPSKELTLTIPINYDLK